MIELEQDLNEVSRSHAEGVADGIATIQEGIRILSLSEIDLDSFLERLREVSD